MNKKICKHYQHPKTCTYKSFCIEQPMSEPTHCCSYLYYSMGLEQKIKKIEEKCKEYSFSTDIYDESDILAGEIIQIIENRQMDE